MKKVFSFAAIAALTIFVASCGNDAAEAKRKADSAHMADSMAQIEMKRKADSTHMADSIAAAAQMAAEKHRADSIHMADSIANAGKKGTSKPKPKPTTKPNEPKVGGHR